jgi:hypothetical protein
MPGHLHLLRAARFALKENAIITDPCGKLD